MQFTIRRAERGDLEALGRLGVLLIREHYAFDPKRFLAPMAGAEQGYGSFLGSVLRSDDGNVFVAEDERDRAILGYVYATLEPMSWMELRGPAGFIQDVVVAEHARRQRVASALLERAIAWLHERNAPRVMLMTAAPNVAAQALFTRFGFRHTMLEMTREFPD
jgi:ribosomal protein S18 acetylase RimI-like enzyme